MRLGRADAFVQRLDADRLATRWTEIALPGIAVQAAAQMRAGVVTGTALALSIAVLVQAIVLAVRLRPEFRLSLIWRAT